MKTISREAIVGYSAEQMFLLVDDIEAYPEFLPYCSGAKELERSVDEVIATLSVSKGRYTKDFTTRNLNSERHSIEMSLVDGPFRHLQGFWNFTELSDNACKIQLKVEFEFSNALLGFAFGKVFNELIESFVDAFELRAKNIYG